MMIINSQCVDLALWYYHQYFLAVCSPCVTDVIHVR